MTFYVFYLRGELINGILFVGVLLVGQVLYLILTWGP